MGAIYDAAKRLADAGTPMQVILETIRDMEALKPQRKAKPAEERATRLPNDWLLPKPWGIWAVTELGFSEEVVRREADVFRDYWCAKAKDATKLDWNATWRGWMRRKAEQTPALTKAPLSAIDRRRAELAERIASDYGIGRQGNRDPRSDRSLAAPADPLLFDI